MAEDAENRPANTEIESSPVDEVILSSIKKIFNNIFDTIWEILHQV